MDGCTDRYPNVGYATYFPLRICEGGTAIPRTALLASFQESRYLPEPSRQVTPFQILSQFLNIIPPTPAPIVDFIMPLTHVDQHTSLKLFTIPDFVLQFCPTHPSEVDLMERFAKLEIAGNQTFDDGQTAVHPAALLRGANRWSTC